MEKYYIGLDIGGTKILGALFNESGDILKRDKKKTKADEGADVIFKQIQKVIEKLLEGIENEQIIALGAGVPGIIDGEKGVVVFSPNMNWENYGLKEALENKYNIPIFIGNDVNVGTLGEWKYGVGVGYKNIVGIFVGTGVGGGMVLNGELYEGTIGAAGEVGHIVMNPDGPYCGCGARGCLESYASKTSMQKEIEAQIKRGRKTILLDLMKKSDSVVLKSEDLREAYDNQDPLAIEVLDEASAYLGKGIATVINLINPELIILGGGVMESMGTTLIPKIEESAVKHTMPKMFEACQIKLAKLGDDAGVFGALALAKRQNNNG